MKELLDRILGLPRQQKIGILVGLIVALLALDFFFLYSPNSAEISKLTEENEKSRGEREKKKKEVANIPKLKEQMRQLDGMLKEAVAQLPEPCGAGELLLTTVLLHRSGQWISGTARLSLARDDAQGYGSAMSYARRYSLAAIVGIATRSDDDDGEAASGEPEATRASGSRPPARDTRAVGGPGVPAAVPAPKSAAVTPGFQRRSAGKDAHGSPPNGFKTSGV